MKLTYVFCVFGKMIQVYHLPSGSAICPWGFPRQGYRSGLPFPSPRDLPDPGIEPSSPAWQVDFLPLSPWEAPLSDACFNSSSSGRSLACSSRRPSLGLTFWPGFPPTCRLTVASPRETDKLWPCFSEVYLACQGGPSKR